MVPVGSSSVAVLSAATLRTIFRAREMAPSRLVGVRQAAALRTRVGGADGLGEIA